MNNQVGGIVGNLKDNNMQNSMRNNSKVLETINKDYKLAMYFYNFLADRNDKLPKYEYIDQIINLHELNNRQLISLAYGISIYVDSINDDKYLSLEYVSPISDTTIRVDKISSNNYSAYSRSMTTIEDLDTKEFPVFKEEKIKYLQAYLQLYQYNHSNNLNDSKTK